MHVHRRRRAGNMATHRSRSPSTPSEGEIIESHSELKATASQPPLNGTSVDLPPRDSNPSAPRSPASLRGSRSPRLRGSWTRSRSRSQSRSPRRDSRGYKRRRDDERDGYEDRHARHEPSRRYGSRYDDRHPDQGAPSHRSRSYYDNGRNDNYGGGLRYTDGYEGRRDKRPHARNRSPYREVRKPKQYEEPELDAGGPRPSAEVKRRRPSTEQVVSERGKHPRDSRDSKLGAETQKNQVQQALPTRAHVADEYVLSLSSHCIDQRLTQGTEQIPPPPQLPWKNHRSPSLSTKQLL